MGTKLAADVQLYLTLAAVFAATFAATLASLMRAALWFDRRAALKAWLRKSEATRDMQHKRDRTRAAH